MAEAWIEETVTREGMTISSMVWRLMGRKPLGFVEKVMEANQNLEKNGPILSIGDVVRFPLHEASDESINRDTTIRLWD